MLFNSYEFIFIFLPVSFLVYFALNQFSSHVIAKIWLVIASLFFYSWWNIVYLPLIIISILFNYFITNLILNCEAGTLKLISKKNLFFIGLAFNIGLLGYFKYMDFFIENVNFAFSVNFQMLNLALPLAISFFTLQQIAYLVDCYEGLIKKTKLYDYVTFVAFFPQLIAGPIVHHSEVMPQFANKENARINYRNLSIGLFIFSLGLFKKVVIADTFSIWASAGFDGGNALNFFEAWFTSFSYLFQIYFDFSGYTDMAIGAALLFNIKLPQNFNSPYKATGMVDYWKRWHITLTNFITTYIYTPILRSFDKITFHKAMLATMLAFLISGLWHGASWMFITFGALNGIGLIIDHYWKKKVKFKLNKVVAWLITINFINLTFIFFRAKEWDDAQRVLTGMTFGNIEIHTRLKFLFAFFNESSITIANSWLYGIAGTIYTPIWIIVCFAIVLLLPNSSELVEKHKPNWVFSMGFIFLAFTAIMDMNKISEFLYFQF